MRFPVEGVVEMAIHGRRGEIACDCSCGSGGGWSFVVTSLHSGGSGPGLNHKGGWRMLLRPLMPCLALHHSLALPIVWTTEGVMCWSPVEVECRAWNGPGVRSLVKRRWVRGPSLAMRQALGG
jgi:hypothetical protein